MITLEADKLVKLFPGPAETVRAVDGVSLQLGQGTLVALMGPSGTGKTTLLSMLGCILRPDSGDLSVCGERVVWNESNLPAYRRRFFGFIAQRSTLLASLNVRENVEVPLRLAGVAGRELVDRAMHALQIVSLTQRAEYPVTVLSAGEKQRVAIARAIAGDPPILLADEPTANLDRQVGTQIVSLLRQLAVEHGKTVMLVTHDDRLLEYADRVVTMEDGHVQVA
jgi:putative ABC transport system ATP-binding protein